MKKQLITTMLSAALCLVPHVEASPVKVGMITTLSGGGSGLGVDVRDGFMLAVNNANNSDLEVIIEDDGRKPSLAVQIADKMIQKDKVDILTGIIWSNLAMAVVPSSVNQGILYLSPNAGPSALAGKSSTKTILTWLGKMIICKPWVVMLTVKDITIALSWHLTILPVRMH